MSRYSRVVRLVAVAMTVTFIAAACSSDSGGGDADGDGGTPTTGGSAVIGAEQWMVCLNPITSCAFSAWYAYAVQYGVMPRLLELDTNGNYVPSAAEAVPTLEDGTVTEDPFSVAFTIRDDAVWDDGSPITSEDVDFTWRAIMNTSGAIGRSGYDLITSISTDDPKEFTIEFSDVYVDWVDLFGGGLQFILQKEAFPAFADDPKPDLSEEMTDEIPFSGGPWTLESWDKQELTLVRNDNYWGDLALMDEVTFVRRQNQETELNSLKSGEVSVIFPQPSNESIADQVVDTPSISTIGGGSPFWEALHFNHDSPPLDDENVRRGIMYAINRQAVVDALVKINAPDTELLNCFGWVPGVGDWCDQTDFAEFTFDPAKAMAEFETAGYDCSGVANGDFCEKDGEPLSIEYTTTAGNARREDTQALLQESAKEAGLDLQTKTDDAAVLFGDLLNTGAYQIADYALGGSPSPSVTEILACEGGQNTDFWCDEEASKLMLQADSEADPAKRLELTQQVGDIVAEQAVGVPMYILPQLTAWRTDIIAGPIGEWNATIYGSFFNMNEWYLVEGGG
ncbi:MAG: peptide ABC transporter substrate-binding protein [Actinomycetota bacterium]